MPRRITRIALPAAAQPIARADPLPADGQAPRRPRHAPAPATLSQQSFDTDETSLLLLLFRIAAWPAIRYEPRMQAEDVTMLDNFPRGTIVIEDLEIGMTRHLNKVVTDEDIEMFATVSTDRNPVHLDDAYAQDTIFEGRIAHGMLTAGLISAVIGEQLPGHGTVYLGQSLKFLGPVRPGDLVRAEVEVLEIDHAKRRVKLDTRCLVAEKVVLKGEATVLAPSRKFD